MHVLMTCVKDEGPFVVEFVAHHLVLGFDRILIASNDCTDGTDDLLMALHTAGYVQHLDIVWQWAKFRSTQAMPSCARALGWMGWTG